jgi:hypothetical protein
MSNATANAGAEIGRHVRPQFGHAFGPLILTTQRNAGEHVRMIRPTIMADKEALILVGLRRLVHLRCSLHRCVHRHVADIVLVQPKLQLLFERQRMETSRCGEAAIDDPLGHAMVEYIEEANVLAGVTHLLGQPLQRARFASEIWTIVDDRNLLGRFGKVLDRVLLEQMHEWLPGRLASS